MNNYIILENRAELTTAQVLGGMNFSAIVAGAASLSANSFGGKTFGNGFMSKGFLTVLLVVSGVAVYKNYISYNDNATAYDPASDNEHVLMRDKSKGPLLMMETIPPKNIKSLHEPPNMACQPGSSVHENDLGNHLTSKGPYVPLVNVDSLNKLEEAVTFTKVPVQLPAQMVQMPSPLTCKKENEMVPNGMTEEQKTLNTAPPFNVTMPESNLSTNARSYLWKPATFNHYVDNAAGEFKVVCSSCNYTYIGGSQLDNKNYVGVWVQVKKTKIKTFELKSGLKNISLIRTNGQKTVSIHPVAIGIDGPQWNGKEWRYISNKFEAEKVTYHFSDLIDFYLIFEDAKVGDRVVIDGFVETLVMEK